MIDALFFLGDINKYISIVVGVLGLGIYFKVSTPIRFLVVYFVFVAVASVFSKMGNQVESNLELFYFYTLMEYVLLGKVFEQVLFAHDLKKNFIWLFHLLLSILVLYTFYFFDSGSLNTESGTLVSLLVIGFSIWFFTLFLNTSLPSFQYIALKWLIISVFLYHCVTLVVLLFGNHINNFVGDQDILVWIFRGLVIFCSKLIVLVVFIKLGIKMLKTGNAK